MIRIKQLRELAGMKQKDLAGLLQCAENTVSYYENEKRAIDPQTIIRLCEIFGCTSDYLLGISSQRTAQITDEEAALVEAYHAAPASVRSGIDALLEPYRKKEKSAAG
ncbi:MAG: helix-turn-helix transcriptional regulator [Oscillospiraceae bacterium]|nr:helix-turn-helix transcriptional regulator [Oscillospiraceae bacterium]